MPLASYSRSAFRLSPLRAATSPMSRPDGSTRPGYGLTPGGSSRAWLWTGQPSRKSASITPGRHPLEDALDFPEIGHLAINLPGVLHGDALDLRARVSPPVDEAQERPDLVEREPEFPAAANEAQ